jgi:hypothetical protein
MSVEALGDFSSYWTASVAAMDARPLSDRRVCALKIDHWIFEVADTWWVAEHQTRLLRRQQTRLLLVIFAQ